MCIFMRFISLRRLQTGGPKCKEKVQQLAGGNWSRGYSLKLAKDTAETGEAGSQVNSKQWKTKKSVTGRNTRY